MKNLFFFFLLLTQVSIAQSILVKWDGAKVNYNPTTNPTFAVNTTNNGVSSQSVSAPNITGAGINFSHDAWNGFTGSSWPTGKTPNLGKYFQLQVSSKTGYQLYVNEIAFTYKGNCKRMRVAYSKSTNFSEAEYVDYRGLDFNNNDVAFEFAFPSTINLQPGEMLYIRIYGFGSTGGSWMLRANPNNTNIQTSTGPAIYGTVGTFNNTVISANPDQFFTFMDEPVTIDVIDNDYCPASNPITNINIVSAPATSAGTVSVNPDKSFTFHPANGYTGTANFTYSISNSISTVNSTAAITVKPSVNSEIVIWNGDSQQRVAEVNAPGITADDITTAGISIDNNDNWGKFKLMNLPASLQNSHYTQFTVATNSTQKLLLSSFKFSFSGQGDKKYQIRYSFDPTFASGGINIANINELVSGGERHVTASFPTDFTVDPSQKLYIRLYAYRTTSDYTVLNLKHSDGGNVGPALVGTINTVNKLVARNDEYTITNTTALDVLGNDTLGTLPLLSITATTPTNDAGTVTVNANNTITFTPSANFEGSSSFSYTLYNGTQYSTATVRLTGPTVSTTTWDGTSWSNFAPNLNVRAIIAGNYNTALNGDITAKSLQITGAKTLTISENTSVVINTDLKVIGDMIVESGGSLVQVEDSGVAAGNVNIKRKTTPIKQYDYTYWSLPVKQAPVNTTTLYGPSIFYTYNPATGWVWTDDNASVAPGKGFISMAPEQLTYNPTQTIEVTFSGVPNTGRINTPVGVGPNLLGNPYPSALDADEFIRANSTLKGTIYLWTHNTAMQYACNGCAATYYTADDYASYNLTGSVRTSPNSIMPTGKIASGQGFFVEAKAAGTVTFENKMRVTASSSNNNFYRPGATSYLKSSMPEGEEVSKSRMWFTLTNTQGAYAQALLGHITGATDGLESGYDGELMDGGNFVTLYTLLDDKKLAIQGRSADFDANQVIPVGYKSTVSGTFTMAIEDVDGFFGEKQVFLVDNIMGTTTNLKEGNYTFTTAAGTFDNRFRLTFANTTLGTDIPVLDKNDIVVIRNAGQVQVRSTVENLSSVTIYDLTGREIAVSNNINSSEFASANLIGGQVVLVKVITENNREMVQKVILK